MISMLSLDRLLNAFVLCVQTSHYFIVIQNFVLFDKDTVSPCCQEKIRKCLADILQVKSKSKSKKTDGFQCFHTCDFGTRQKGNGGQK